jgi:hypothetical protein
VFENLTTLDLVFDKDGTEFTPWTNTFYRLMSCATQLQHVSFTWCRNRFARNKPWRDVLDFLLPPDQTSGTGAADDVNDAAEMERWSAGAKLKTLVLNTREVSSSGASAPSSSPSAHPRFRRRQRPLRLCFDLLALLKAHATTLTKLEVHNIVFEPHLGLNWGQTSPQIVPDTIRSVLSYLRETDATSSPGEPTEPLRRKLTWKVGYFAHDRNCTKLDDAPITGLGCMKRKCGNTTRILE